MSNRFEERMERIFHQYDNSSVQSNEVAIFKYHQLDFISIQNKEDERGRVENQKLNELLVHEKLLMASQAIYRNCKIIPSN
jgi:hypothetical protein